MNRSRSLRLRLAIAVAAAAAVLAGARMASAEGRYALIVSGAAGGQNYVEQYALWTDALSKVLVERMKLGPADVHVLSDTKGDAAATAENVRRTLNTIRQSMTREDLLLVVLIGHGTFDGVDAKFNLVGPDLSSSEWASLLRGVPGRVVIVNTSSASFPFIERLSGPRRIVITATDSVTQNYDTVFPEFFVKAFDDEAADIDKNGRISIWETFAAATAGVKRSFQQRGLLATEHALLDDNGDGAGKEADADGEDGSAAARTYLDESLPGAAPTDEVLLRLLQRKTALEREVEDLKIRRTFLPAPEYAKEFERLMIELARVSRDIRTRVKS
jgi:hypothetical protein